MEQEPPKNSDAKEKKIERKHGPARPFPIPIVSSPSPVNPEFEGFKEKFVRKVKENPIVPLGSRSAGNDEFFYNHLLGPAHFNTE